MNTGTLFPNTGEHQNLENGEQSGNTRPKRRQNPRSGHKNTVPQETGNSRGTVPKVIPVSPPLKVGNGEPGPHLVDLFEHNIDLTETENEYVITFPTRSSMIRAGLRPKTLLKVGQALPDKPIRFNHHQTNEPPPSNKPLKIQEAR